MPASMTEEENTARRAKVLDAARWCFLNFGFAKTSFEDIAKRAEISRTLLYRIFKDKEDIYRAVFAHWLVARHPGAVKLANDAGDPTERLIAVCKQLVVEPWIDMVGAPMGGEFLEMCAKIDPAIEQRHRKVVLECSATILGDVDHAKVFVLALDGLLLDEPSPSVLTDRIKLLAACFVLATAAGKRAPRPRAHRAR